ncbi:MAG: septal ring lytic transglycosylase RlpA family protein [Burkholderiaceae bacterium]|nr:septal ring lytic transglycosylase RlpA family protein [Burkholderiaceae bacterium]
MLTTLVLPLSMSLMNAPGAAKAAAGDTHKTHKTHKTQKGKASYYGAKFAGKKMASGEPMNPRSNVAASKTLPLGTKAKVTNLKTGKSAEVVIKDRGPYVDGRIIDVSPKTAEKLDLKKDGTAPVAMQPLHVPKRADGAKPEAGRPSSSK